ncbi:MAG: hypothetical protein J2P37_19365 [Ktedonobacteraceae bacterium]|nr:hypothetical protein [Ktedonobacteraceae bacterium]
METVQAILMGVRNLYIVVMFLPLWLWSAIYRYQLPGFHWLEESWNAFSILALLYGALGLWFFAQLAVEAHYAGKPHKALTVSVWAIAITLFVACLGAVIDQGSKGWGSGLFFLGIDALPLVMLFCLQAHTLEDKKANKKEHEAEKQAVSGDG